MTEGKELVGRLKDLTRGMRENPKRDGIKNVADYHGSLFSKNYTQALRWLIIFILDWFEFLCFLFDKLYNHSK